MTFENVLEKQKRTRFFPFVSKKKKIYFFSFSFSRLSKPAPQLEVRLRLCPSRHGRLDRAVGLRGGHVDVVVELFRVFFFVFFENDEEK